VVGSTPLSLTSSWTSPTLSHKIFTLEALDNSTAFHTRPGVPPPDRAKQPCKEKSTSRKAYSLPQPALTTPCASGWESSLAKGMVSSHMILQWKAGILIGFW